MSTSFELNTKLTAHELDTYKAHYFNSKSIWQRLLPRCRCDLCRQTQELPVSDHISAPALTSAQSLASLNRSAMSYSLHGSSTKVFTFQQKSLSLHYSQSDLMLRSVDSSTFHEDHSLSVLACECTKEQSLPLVQVMGIGLKNKVDDLMHTLNDINSRLILQQLVPSTNDVNRVTVTNPKGVSHSVTASVSTSVIDGVLDEVPILKLPRFKNIKPLHQAIRTCYVLSIDCLLYFGG